MPLRRARTSRYHVLSALLSLSLSPPYLSAQTPTTGAISGHIVDPLGRPISAAAITIADLARRRYFTLESNPAGDFLAPSLPPSEYSLDIRSPSFRPLHLGIILVELGATARIHAALQPSTVQTSITVTQTPPSTPIWTPRPPPPRPSSPRLRSPASP